MASFISFRNFSHSFVISNLLVIHEEYDSLSVEIFGKFIFITFLLFLRIPETKQPNFSFCFVTNENLSRVYGPYHTYKKEMDSSLWICAFHRHLITWLYFTVLETIRPPKEIENIILGFHE